MPSQYLKTAEVPDALVTAGKPRRPQRAPHRLTPEEVDELEAGYRAGEPVNALTARFQINRKTLYNHMNSRGVPLRNRRLK